MQLQRPLLTVTQSVDGDVLTVLAGAHAEFTPPEIHRLIGRWSEQGVRKSLLRLVRQGTVLSRGAGNAYLYQLNRDHLAAPAILELAALRATFLERLRHTISGWDPPPEFAALFGSAARSEMTETSDIDIVVIRPSGLDTEHDSWVDQRAALTSTASAWTGNDVRILELSMPEVHAGLSSGDPVVVDIVKHGTDLYGSLTDLKAKT